MRGRGIWSPCWSLRPRERHYFFQEKWYNGAIPRKVALSTLALLPPSKLSQFIGHRLQLLTLPCFYVHATPLNDNTMASWCHCHLTVFCSECYGEPVARMPQSLGDWKQWLLILHERIVLLLPRRQDGYSCCQEEAATEEAPDDQINEDGCTWEWWRSYGDRSTAREWATGICKAVILVHFFVYIID